MAAKVVKCRRGDACNFKAHVKAPGELDAAYTLARFQVRDAFDDTADAIIAVDETTGVTFDYPNNDVYVSIGATLTGAIDVGTEPREVAALLRLYNPLDPDDVISWRIPFVLLPDAIDDV